MTKAAYLAKLRELIVARYPWAQDAAKLGRFMDAARVSLGLAEGQQADIGGQSFTDAWRALGGKGKPTLKALRALPA